MQRLCIKIILNIQYKKLRLLIIKTISTEIIITKQLKYQNFLSTSPSRQIILINRLPSWHVTHIPICPINTLKLYQR